MSGLAWGVSLTTARDWALLFVHVMNKIPSADTSLESFHTARVLMAQADCNSSSATLSSIIRLHTFVDGFI
jgi:hypothetical protein